MSKKLLLGWGTLLGGLSVWLFISNTGKTKIKEELYDVMKRASLSIIAKCLLKPWIKKIAPLLF
ncbi:hypothetical protein [Cardinium endosymbiont of Oedothorax gibbosus]|uniref:hypothetical protein n=1 Tax=Cardinium endosymbiont of Oedothorax gibbosus TaxID=931101 RepID=UPI002024EE92|nr:hypothetical protein [Cardinium endosymbiont of Oedothorax gibbosus]